VVLGYGLDDEIPDHSVLSKARKRWGKEFFLSLFSRVVHQCVEAPEVIRAIDQTAREQVQKLDEPENEEDDQSPSDPGAGGPSTQSPTGR
jgi:Transposase domain (DUF772)